MAQPIETRVVINTYETAEQVHSSLTFSTGNEKKQIEIRRILGDSVQFVILPDFPEIQGDPTKVAIEKAKKAWELNGFEPVIIEDVSLIIHNDQDLLIPTEVKKWGETRIKRAKVCDRITGDRTATVLATYARFDGINDPQVWEGWTTGTIADTPRGSDRFGFDDIFIPDGDTRTFSEMTPEEKDMYSMRRKGLEEIKKSPPPPTNVIFRIQEPADNEMARVREKELLQDEAVRFAFNVDALAGNQPNYEFNAPHYNPMRVEVVRHNGAVFYKRYTTDPDPNSPNLGLIETDFIKDRIKHYANGDPVIWQMGKDRRKLALSQRAEYFMGNQNQRIHDLLDKYEDPTNLEYKIPVRSNKRSPAIEEALGVKYIKIKALNGETRTVRIYTRTEALEAIGYKKRSADTIVSRQIENVEEVFNKIGKYYRRVVGAGSMPPTTGSADVLATMALGHMLSFVPRNSRYAGYPERQLTLFQRAVDKINDVNIPEKWKERARRNIGISLGAEDPEAVVKEAEKFYEAGARLFRIYTINSDIRVVDTARKLRERFGDEIEIFVGQVPDKKMGRRLIAPDIRVDALILGHGGGQQCDSGGNGMAITTTEEEYEFTTDPVFKHVSIGGEGSFGRDLGTYMKQGMDFFLYNQRLVNSGIENPAGDLYFEHIKSTEKNPRFVQSYPGSASSESLTIEAVNPALTVKRIKPSGRTKGPEGASGFMVHRRRAGGTIVFNIDSILRDAAKALADSGVRSFRELRASLLYEPMDISDEEIEKVLPDHRHMTQQSQYVAKPHGET